MSLCCDSYKDDSRILSTNERLKVNNEQSDAGYYELVIPEVKPEDAGKYSCVAINSFGEERCDAQLSVVGESQNLESSWGESCRRHEPKCKSLQRLFSLPLQSLFTRRATWLSVFNRLFGSIPKQKDLSIHLIHRAFPPRFHSPCAGVVCLSAVRVPCHDLSNALCLHHFQTTRMFSPV